MSLVYQNHDVESEYGYDLRLNGDENSSSNEEEPSRKDKADDKVPKSSPPSSPKESKSTRNAPSSKTQRSKRQVSRKDSSGTYDLWSADGPGDQTEQQTPPSSSNQNKEVKTETLSSSKNVSWRDALIGFLLGLLVMAFLRPYVLPSNQGNLTNQ